MSTPETIRAYARSICADLFECTEEELAADESKDTAATIARVETMLGQFAAEVQKDEELNVEIEHDGYTWSASATNGMSEENLRAWRGLLTALDFVAPGPEPVPCEHETRLAELERLGIDVVAAERANPMVVTRLSQKVAALAAALPKEPG